MCGDVVIISSIGMRMVLVPESCVRIVIGITRMLLVCKSLADIVLFLG